MLIVAWFSVTQPLLPTKRAGSTVEVDPARLESHVSILAETFVPRDYKHPENLDRAAAYIRGEFEHTNGRVWEQTYEVDSLVYRNVILQLGLGKESSLALTMTRPVGFPAQMIMQVELQA